MKNKNNVRNLVLALSTALMLASCANQGNESGSIASGEAMEGMEHDHSSMQHEQPGSVNTNISAELAANVIDLYLELKDALIQADGMAAQSAARTLIGVIPESQDMLANSLLSDSKQIASSTDVTAQRSHFKALSNDIYMLAKAVPGQKLYRQYCPMAFDHTGAYWISSEKEIYNPYFGDEMLHCGSVKEEL